MNPDDTEREQELMDEVMDAELILIEAIEEARGALGQRQENAQDAGQDVAESDLKTWEDLADDLRALIASKNVESNALRNPRALPAGQVRSRRAVEAQNKKADDIDSASAELSVIEVSLREACAAVGGARAASDEFMTTPRADGITGELEALLKKLFVENHINIQAYWAGTVVGPDARRWLDTNAAILGALKAKMEQVHGSQIANDFYTRYSSCFGPLAVVAHLARAVSMLTEPELTELEENCTLFVASFRTAFPDHKIVTPKLHIIEKHIPYFARRFGTCGVFGEDGLESLHPMDAKARLIVRTMRSPLKRHQAATKHLDIKSQN